MNLLALKKARYLARHFSRILRHPLNRDQPLQAAGRYFGWQLGSRLLGRNPVLYPFVNDLRLQIGTGMHGATGVVYFGLEEYRDMAFCAHFLRPGDLFIDVGACFGTYTALASGVAGADTIAFEPHPKNAGQLRENARLNRFEDRVQIRVAAVGAARGTVSMTASLQGANHVVVAGGPDYGASMEVAMTTLDDELGRLSPIMVKIDVEGYEQEVLAGGTTVFAMDSLLAVLMEDAGLGNRYSRASAQHRRMLEFGFRSFRYDPETRALVDLEGEPNRVDINTLYLRDVAGVRERVSNAKPFRIRDRMI